MKFPYKTSLADQVAEHIRTEIKRGVWKQWLPPERKLSKEMEVNRRTISSALRLLEKERLIRTIPRKGNRILAAPGKYKTRKSNPVIGILISDVHKAHSFGFDKTLSCLQERCFQNRITLKIYQGKQYFRNDPSRPLERLVEQNLLDCWVLRSSDARVQRWFARRKIPAVVWGQCQPDIALPSVSVDIEASVRHAVGTLLGAGHRRIALFVECSKTSHVTRDVFLQSMRNSNHADTLASVFEYEPEAASIRRILDKCLKRSPSPTAFVITRAYGYMAITSLLFQCGLRIPRDVSVISRDDSPLFEFLSPQPARFVFSPDKFSKCLFALVKKNLQNQALSQTSTKLLPEFIKGQSIGQRSIRSRAR